jgi:competence protein ComEC
MYRWIPYAFVRIVVFFSGGVLLAIYYPDCFQDSTSFLIFCVSGIVYLILALYYSRLRINPGFVGMLAIFMAGYINVQWKNESRRSDHLINIRDTITHYTVVVTKPAQEKERTWKYEATILEVKTNLGWTHAIGKILLYASKEGVSEQRRPKSHEGGQRPPKSYEGGFRPGDNLLIKGVPRLIQPPANPGAFDLQKFSAYKNIFHQHFIRNDDDIKWLGNKPANKFLHYATMSRLWADSVLRAHIHGKREQSLASALVLGVTDGLDNDLLNAYSASGAMHVLSVSGLHVGIIYWVILMIFKPFQKLKYSKWILAATSLAVLWTYAFITGLSPSVLRAVMMFSFVALARPIGRQTNIYNTLAASAFILLVYDPYMIVSVGFQLSFVAVIGIVGLQPPLYRLWEPDSRFWDEVWKITSVSIAAQLATFSLGLFYFHQFPNYFLITNLLVIPLSFIVLLMGIGVIFVGYSAGIASVLGWALEWIIRILNEGVFLIERLPFSVFDNVYISKLQCCILLLLVVVIYAWVETKRSVPLIIGSLLCILYSMDQWIHLQKDVKTPKAIFYNIPGHTAIDFIEAGRTNFVSDSAMAHDVSKIEFHVVPGRLLAGVRNVQAGAAVSKELNGCALMVWNKKTIVQIKDPTFVVPANLEVDIIIISNNAVRSIGTLMSRVKAKEYIIDSSNSFRAASRLLEESQSLDIEITSLLHHGAYTKII